MEIIHVVLGKANPERMNGVNKVVYQLATHQAAQGKKVSVWGITGSLEINFAERAFTTRLYKAYRNPFRIDTNLHSDIIKMKGKAVFHLHGGWIPAFASLSKIFAANAVPFVLTPHGAYNTVAMQRSSLMKKIYFQLFERKLLTRVNYIHCIGESEVQGLNSIYETKKTFLTPYGFESMSDDLSKRTTYEHEFIIGFVGRLDIYTKGLDLLLDAFENFSDTNQRASVWIVGDGKERGKLERMIVERHLEKNVIVWGSKFGKEKDDLLNQMDVFVHPSRNEGLPSAVLEAAALGIPSVVSVATNVGNFIKKYNAGRVVDNENPSALKFALEELSVLKTKGILGGLGANAQKMVKEVFNWNHIVNEFDRLYQAV